ncbi:hypothetical protein CN613_13255 [Bacillus pseudomycoides]|uniref:Uncharacterized protein n=1 Tax=Bacillus pseudomycoides TaxID=64104 RepID=A0A2A8C549_9BACI|nr:hypothetical protein CON79_20760 [Bacillus pseudomycoides]PEA82389.1 hypothetical protein CON99_17185 [Bacillus pseudomycoides]PEK66825.1 hypothetical protein CN590_15870 [Bacillus pseudomycoides]PEL28620.1 hypothetical protein CN608_10160 [Bacillus pseudomycoides]PEM68887.1 hypothetical protein CN613_13255 [Bacillus pseudomycoides]
METKADLHSFTPFVLTWHGAGKGPNRFYAWLDALSHLKIRFYSGFSICTYIFISYQKRRKIEKNKSDKLLFFNHYDIYTSKGYPT